MREDDLPLHPPADPPAPARLAPAWMALVSAWAGLVALIASIVLPFLPGSTDPRAELEHAAPWSLADRFIPVPLYGSAVGLCLGLIVVWSMRRQARPLSDALVLQRAQAWVGIVLSALAAGVVYAWVAIAGPAGGASSPVL